MPNYKVAYQIEVEADNEMDAALQVEEILNDMDYRPCLQITGPDNKTVKIDLETGGGDDKPVKVTAEGFPIEDKTTKATTADEYAKMTVKQQLACLATQHSMSLKEALKIRTDDIYGLPYEVASEFKGFDEKRYADKYIGRDYPEK